MAICENIRLLRKEKGLTQVQLAEALGTSQQVITSYERGIAKPDPDKLPQIAEILGVSIEVLFNPEARLLKKSAREQAVRKGSRLSTIQDLYAKLNPTTQRIVLSQVKALVKSGKL